MNRIDLLLIAILILLVIYIYQKREYLPAEAEQEAIKACYCVAGEEKKCNKDCLCNGNKVDCAKLCVSGNSEPLEPGIRKCL